jgi:peptide/nickel transport system permease protein
MRQILHILGKRLLLGLVTLFVISILIFSAVQLLPGDAAEALLGQSATPDSVAALRRDLHLDLPAPTRYAVWIADIARGDLGRSLASGRPVADLLKERLPNTLFLAGFAAIISVPLSLLFGVFSALHRNGALDRITNFVALGAISFPEFFVAYVLVIVFAVQLTWFPPLSVLYPGTSFPMQLYKSVLPAVTLTFATAAHMLRMTRASILSVLSMPYIEMARLKGLSAGWIVWRHALPNALGPIANVVALNLAYLLVGVVVVETVFVYPGLGQLLVDSVSKRDLPVIQAISLVFATAYVVLNLVADIIGVISNPRLRQPH